MGQVRAVKQKEKITVGLDVGHRRINMVKLSSADGGLKLLDFACANLDLRQGREERLKHLQQTAQEKDLTALPVNIGLSGESVIVRYIDLPKMKNEEVKEALKYEAQQYIPFKLEEVVFDFHILEPLNSTRNRMKVLLVAAKRQAIMEVVKLIRQAGIKPGHIDVNSFSLINCFQVNGPKIKEADVFALVNLEFDVVNIDILQGELPYFTRDISLLEDALSLPQEKDEEEVFFETVRPLLANLIRELRLSIDYFENEYGKQVSVIYLSGEGVGFSRLVSFFREQLGREVNLWNPLRNLFVDSTRIDIDALNESSCMLALACGLALRRR